MIFTYLFDCIRLFKCHFLGLLLVVCLFKNVQYWLEPSTFSIFNCHGLARVESNSRQQAFSFPFSWELVAIDFGHTSSRSVLSFFQVSLLYRKYPRRGGGGGIKPGNVMNVVTFSKPLLAIVPTCTDEVSSRAEAPPVDAARAFWRPSGAHRVPGGLRWRLGESRSSSPNKQPWGVLVRVFRHKLASKLAQFELCFCCRATATLFCTHAH